MRKFVILILCMIMLTSTVSASSQPSLWAAKEVSTAISLGLVPKELQSNYTVPITRIEFVQLIMKLANIWAPEGTAERVAKFALNLPRDMFSDTEDVNVLYCASLGIVEGDGKGYFMPKELLQRQQAAKILYKAADNFTALTTEDKLHTTIYRGYASYEMPHSFQDSSLLRSWSRMYVNWCYRYGIMEGIEDHKFAPEQAYTREQAILTTLRLYYAYGMADKLSTIPPVDYYPIYGDKTMANVSYWIDSTLAEGTPLQLPEIFRTSPNEYTKSGLMVVQNTNKIITLSDAFGDTVKEIDFVEPAVLLGIVNGLVVVEDTASKAIQYYTPTGTLLPTHSSGKPDTK